MNPALPKISLNRTEICRLIGIGAMLVWATVLLGFYVSGRINSYIRPEYLRVSTLVAGVGLLALAAFNLRHLRDGAASCCEDHDHDHVHAHKDAHDHDHDHDHKDAHDHDHDHDHEHEHEHEDRSYTGNGALFAVMVVPLLFAVFQSQDRYLSAATIRNKGFAQDPNAVAGRVGDGLAPTAPANAEEDKWEYTLADLEKVVDRSAEGNLLLTVDQLFYTAGDEELQRVLAGQAVETVGQVIPETEFKKGERLRLFTLMVTCCAADAQPVSVPIEFSEPLPAYKEMQWVKVSGVMDYPTELGRKQAVLRVKRLEPTEEPVNDLLY